MDCYPTTVGKNFFALVICFVTSDEEKNAFTKDGSPMLGNSLLPDKQVLFGKRLLPPRV